MTESGPESSTSLKFPHHQKSRSHPQQQNLPTPNPLIPNHFPHPVSSPPSNPLPPACYL